MENKGRVALVTGAAKRVGRTIALRLADEGFDIAFTFLSSVQAAQSLVKEIEAKGRKALAISADLTDPAKAIDAIALEFRKTFTRLDVLVNNASLYETSSLGQADLKQMRRFWAIHVESPTMLCKAFASMLEAAEGSIVNMVDVSAEKPMAKYLTYCASKAGLWNLTLGLARELAPRVTVNGIAPGVVEWPADLPDSEREKYLARVPLGRAGTPEDVAEAVIFLCTGGKYMTGQILRLDGGRSVT